jgi:hypothetical protein
MADTPRRTAEDSHLGDPPASWAHRPVSRPEEGNGRASDVMAFLGSGAIVIGGTALLAWLLYSALG